MTITRSTKPKYTHINTLFYFKPKSNFFLFQTKLVLKKLYKYNNAKKIIIV